MKKSLPVLIVDFILMFDLSISDLSSIIDELQIILFDKRSSDL